MGKLARLMNEVVWNLPAPSQEFAHGPHILISPGRVTLRWDAETESGDYAWSSAEFVGVEAAAFTGDDSCTPEQAAAYDQLVKVEPSGMLSSLRGAEGKFLHHYRIYFDEVGCLDVVAEDFNPPGGSGVVT
jgi:hypothetical protein